MQDHFSPTDSLETAQSEPMLDPRRVLESVVTELEMLRHDRPTAAASGLIELHGALLLYGLDGRAELLPSFGFPAPGRRFLEFRVVASARRLARSRRGSGGAAATQELAAARIEQLIHLIDPDLRSAAA